VRELSHQVKEIEHTNRKCETQNLMPLDDKLDLIDDIKKERNVSKIKKMVPKPIFNFFISL